MSFECKPNKNGNFIFGKEKKKKETKRMRQINWSRKCTAISWTSSLVDLTRFLLMEWIITFPLQLFIFIMYDNNFVPTMSPLLLKCETKLLMHRTKPRASLGSTKTFFSNLMAHPGMKLNRYIVLIVWTFFPIDHNLERHRFCCHPKNTFFFFETRQCMNPTNLRLIITLDEGFEWRN